jgi:hypothetical protein
MEHPMPDSRRMREHMALFVAISLLAAIGHVQAPDVTESLSLSYRTIPIILSLYLGYKTGPVGGLVAGLMTSLPWTVAVALTNTSTSWFELCLGSGLEARDLPVLGDVRLTDVSLQAALLCGGLAWVAGTLLKRLDESLARNGLGIADLAMPGRPVAALPAVVDRLRQWLAPVSGSESPTFGTIIVRLLQARELRALSAWLLLVLLNLRYEFGEREARFGLLPTHLSAVIVTHQAAAGGRGR